MFESGGGDDATVWKNMLQQVAAVTARIWKELDRPIAAWHILNDVKGLEVGLAKLGYSGEIMIVAHSLGGFYATLLKCEGAQDRRGRSTSRL